GNRSARLDGLLRASKRRWGGTDPTTLRTRGPVRDPSRLGKVDRGDRPPSRTERPRRFAVAPGSTRTESVAEARAWGTPPALGRRRSLPHPLRARPRPQRGGGAAGRDGRRGASRGRRPTPQP